MNSFSLATIRLTFFNLMCVGIQKNQNTKINDHFEQNFCSLIYNKINSSKVLNLIHIFLGN